MSKAIIDFERGDISALKEISDKLQAIIDKEGAVGDAWRQTSAEMNAQNKTNTDQTNKLAQSIDQLTVASKSMDKVVIGGAYKNYLKQIQDQLGLTGKELINYIQNARKAAQAEIFNPSNSKEKIDELTLSIKVMDDTLKSLGATEDGAGEKTVSLRQRIREVKDELVSMADAGLQGTPAFVALQKKAGELDDQMRDLNATIRGTGSDTRNLDGLISLVSGVAGGYAVAQGAAALFGNENNEVAQALLKVNAAMSILQGLQQVQQVLLKESSASILLENLFRKQKTVAIAENTVATVADTAASEADTVAKAAETAATAEATAATEGLNVAMAANPVGIVLVSILALVAAYSLLSDNTRETAKWQSELNNDIEESGKLADFDIDALKKRNDVLLANAKTQGASQTQLTALEGNLTNQSLALIKKKLDAATNAENELLDQINKRLENNKKVDKSIYDSYNELVKNREALDKQYNDTYQQQLLRRAELEQQIIADNYKSYNAYIQSQVASAVAGTDAERDAQIAAIREIAAARENDPAFKALTSGEQFLARANDEKQIQALQLQNYQHYLKGRTAALDAELAIQKAHQATSNADEIANINKITDLQIASIRKTAAEQIKGNPTLNAGEIKKINDEANLAIVEAEKKKQQDILAVQKNELTLQLAAAEKGSYDEYIYNLALIENERQAEVAAAGKNKDLIKAIDAKYRKEKHDADIAFNVVQLNDEISRDNAALARFGISEQDKLELTLKRLEDEKAVEIAQANGNAAKIAEIDAKYIQQTRDAKIASIDAVKNKEIEAYQAYHDEVMKVDQRIADDALLNVNLRVSALEDLKREQEQELQIEFNALEKKKGLIEDYDVQYQILLNKRKDIAENIEKQITQIEKQEIDKRVSQMQSLFDFFKKGFQSFLPQDAFSVALSSLTDFSNSAIKTFANLKQQVAEYNKIIFDPASSSADVLQAAADKRIAQTQAVQQAEIAATQAAQDIVNQIYADGSAQRQQQLQDDLQALQDERAKELENTNRSELQKAAINKQFDQKEKKIKLDAWKADQQAKKESAIINGLLAITRTYAEYGFTPAGWIAAAAQALATGIIVADISTQKPPKFRHGKIDIQGPGTSTSDSIPSLISKGESVIKAESTAKWKDALIAINDDHFEDYLSQKFKSFVFPHIPDNVPIPIGQQKEIDYDRLAVAVAKEMKGVIPAPKSTHVNIDKTGIHTITQEGNTRTEWKNKRYSMN